MALENKTPFRFWFGEYRWVCLYQISKEPDGTVRFVIFAVYVGDIVSLSNDVQLLKIEKANLCKKFKMVDHREAHSILGMLIKRDRAAKTLFINQPSYLLNILKKFCMENYQSVATLLEMEEKFQKIADHEEECDQLIYQQAIGILTYASTSTRPDIAAAVGVLSLYSANPSKQHWTGVKGILRHIKETFYYGLNFSVDSENQLHGFSNACCAGTCKASPSRTTPKNIIFRWHQFAFSMQRLCAMIPVDEFLETFSRLPMPMLVGVVIDKLL